MSLDFMIIGAQKAATSALQAALRTHPELYMPVGESAFFEDPEFTERRWDNPFPAIPAHRKRGIKRPDYLCSDEAIERIVAAVPEARFIVVLREPVSRALSSYHYMIRHAHLPSRPLNSGIEACLDAFERGRPGRAAAVISNGLYARYLQRWWDAVPSERFLVLSQREVAQTPQAAIERCEAHLSVSHQVRISDQGMGESNVGLYDPQLLRVARVASLLKTRPLPGSYRRVPRALPLRVAGAALSRATEAVAARRPQRMERLDPHLQQRLDAIYREDLTLLRKLVAPTVLYWVTG